MLTSLFHVSRSIQSVFSKPPSRGRYRNCIFKSPFKSTWSFNTLPTRLFGRFWRTFVLKDLKLEIKVKTNHIFVKWDFQSCRITSISAVNSSSSYAVWLKTFSLLLCFGGEVSHTCSHTESTAAPVKPVKPAERFVPAVQKLSCRSWCVLQQTDKFSFFAWCSWTKLRCPNPLEGNKIKSHVSTSRLK